VLYFVGQLLLMAVAQKRTSQSVQMTGVAVFHPNLRINKKSQNFCHSEACLWKSAA
jgi:hypothetical protein